MVLLIAALTEGLLWWLLDTDRLLASSGSVGDRDAIRCFVLCTRRLAVGEAEWPEEGTQGRSEALC